MENISAQCFSSLLSWDAYNFHTQMLLTSKLLYSYERLFAQVYQYNTEVIADEYVMLRLTDRLEKFSDVLDMLESQLSQIDQYPKILVMGGSLYQVRKKVEQIRNRFPSSAQDSSVLYFSTDRLKLELQHLYLNYRTLMKHIDLLLHELRVSAVFQN